MDSDGNALHVTTPHGSAADERPPSVASVASATSATSATLIERVGAALDAPTRQMLALRCGYAPPIVAMSVAGFVTGHLTATYRERLKADGIVLPSSDADTNTSASVRAPASSQQRPFITPGRYGAIDLQPLIGGVQRAIRPHLDAALQEQALEGRVLHEVLSAVVTLPDLRHLLPSLDTTDATTGTGAGDPAVAALLRNAVAGHPLAQRVHPLALDFMHATAQQAVDQAHLHLHLRSLDEIEAMLGGRGLAGLPVPDGRRIGAVRDPFEHGAAAIPVNPAVWALLRAIRDAIRSSGGWHDASDTHADHDAAPTPRHTTHTNRGRGRIVVDVRPAVAVDMASVLTDAPAGPSARSNAAMKAATTNALWQRVRGMDDLTADALLVCLAAWVAAGAGSEPVWVSVDAILDARGLRRMQRADEPDGWQHGHRREDRLAAGRALAQLDTLWLQVVDVDVVPARGGRAAQRVHGHSRALALLDRITATDSSGELVVLAARVQPGEWARAFAQAGMRSTGTLQQQTLRYDPYRERPERWLARYLAFSARWNRQRRSPTLRLRVTTLLENAALDADPRRPQRTRDRLERALERLRTDDLLAAWHYEADPGDLPARRWLEQWLQMIVVLEIPRSAAATVTGASSSTSPD